MSLLGISGRASDRASAFTNLHAQDIAHDHRGCMLRKNTRCDSIRTFHHISDKGKWTAGNIASTIASCRQREQQRSLTVLTVDVQRAPISCGYPLPPLFSCTGAHHVSCRHHDASSIFHRMRDNAFSQNASISIHSSCTAGAKKLAPMYKCWGLAQPETLGSELKSIPAIGLRKSPSPIVLAPESGCFNG